MTARSAIVSERSSSGVSEARYLPRKYQERFERDAEARSKSDLVTGSTSALRKAAARPVVMKARKLHQKRVLPVELFAVGMCQLEHCHAILVRERFRTVREKRFGAVQPSVLTEHPFKGRRQLWRRHGCDSSAFQHSLHCERVVERRRGLWELFATLWLAVNAVLLGVVSVEGDAFSPDFV